MQVLVDLDGRGVITIFPECTPLTFALVVLLRSAPRDELHALRNNIRTCVFDQKMNMVGCHQVIEHRKTKTFLGLEKPPLVTASVAHLERAGISRPFGSSTS